VISLIFILTNILWTQYIILQRNANITHAEETIYIFVFVKPLYSVIHETLYIMSGAKEFENGLSRLLAL
jgi:hypothetical protein